MAASLTAGSAIPVFTDVFFSPLTMHSLSEIIVDLLPHPPEGVFNVGSRDGLSKAEFAFAFAKAMALPQDLLVPSCSDTVTANRARRPKDMRMNVKAIESALGRQMPTLADEIVSLGRAHR
jgi:dTDP-4-dehydrorhamnose reductase